MAIIDGPPREAELFGHPRGLTYLFTTEMWERFSYYGMRAILVLYLTNYLLLPGHFENVIGYHAIKGMFEYFTGPLAVQPFSSLIYGFYTGLVYLTPFFGGMLADRVLGQRYSVIIGGVLMAAGEFMLTSDALFFPGLLMLILGNGAFKPNISTQVGGLYKPGDSRIDRAYSIFYVGINVGATFSPLVCGTLGEEVGWHYGFLSAGIGMVIGLFIYMFALRTLPADQVTRNKAAHTGKLTSQDWKVVAALILLCVPTTFFWATYEQSGNTINLWMQDFTNRGIDLGFWHGELLVTWVQVFNPAMIFMFTPLVIMFWSWQAKRGREPSVVTKMAIGCILVGLAYVILAVEALLIGPHGHGSWLWLVLYFAVLTTGELYLSPIGLSLVARVAPVQILSAMMGMWFITSFTGNLLEGWLGSFYSGMNKTNFFLMMAAIAAVAGVVIWVFDKPLKPILEMKPHDPPMLPEPQ